MKTETPPRRLIFRIILGVSGSTVLLALVMVFLFYRHTNPELDPLIEDLANRPLHNLDRLVICIDGVSWSFMQSLQAHGAFSTFRPASKVLVTFPAMTNVSLSDIWHTDQTPGYESLYFDRDFNRYGGGTGTYLGRRRPSGRDYHTILDYEEPRQYEFLVYVSPLRIIYADMRRAILRLFESTRREQRHYIKSSDGLIHLRGDSGAMEFAQNLDAFVSALYRSSGGRTEVVVFSDHGNEFVPSSRVPLDDVLTAAGYTVGEELAGPKSVVIPAFGLVSFASIYAPQEAKAAIADLLAQEVGVDFVVHRKQDRILVQSAAGLAEIRWREAGAFLKYAPQSADPLGLSDSIERLREKGCLDEEGYASNKDWLRVTAGSEYPDSLYRIWKGLTQQVDFPGDLLVSFEKGFFYGNRTFDRFFKIEATHGSLRPDSSEAFLMSTHRDFPPILRGEDIIQYLGPTVALESFYLMHASDTTQPMNRPHTKTDPWPSKERIGVISWEAGRRP